MREHDKSDALLYIFRSTSLPIAAFAIVNSIWLIIAHGQENRHPALRVYTMRILMMVIIDSVAAVIALWGTGWMRQMDPLVENIMHFVVELYESVVIFSFLQFVLACGAGPERLAAQFRTRGRKLEPAESSADDDGRSCSATEGAGSLPMITSKRTTVADRARRSQPQPPQDESDEDAIATSVDGTSSLGSIESSTCEDEDSELEAPRRPSTQFADRPSSLAQPMRIDAAWKPRELKHLPGFGRILPPWRSGRQMLRWCVLGTLSYVVTGATLAIVGILLLVIPVGAQNKKIVWTVSMGLLSATQAIAIFALASLAVNVRDEIALLRPYGKFLSVKFVVFFAFWQGMLLKALEKLGAFGYFESGCGETCAVTVTQNFLICLEMLAASLIHFYVFSPYDYLKLLAQHRVDGHASPKSLGSPPTVAEVVDFRDIFSTAWQVHLCRSKSQLGDCEQVVRVTSTNTEAASA